MPNHTRLVVVVLLCSLPLSLASGAPPAADSPASEAWYQSPQLSVGADVGLETAVGKLAPETNLGPTLRAVVGANPGWVPYLRGELALGSSRLGRSVAGGPSALYRVPLTLSALGFLPGERLFGASALGFPVPYLRLGAGLSGAFAGEAAALDAMLLWGVGARYPLRGLGTTMPLTATLDVTHSVVFESVVGQFVGLTAGLEVGLVFDRDGDGLADTQDRCPDDPEDPDGFEDDDGCADADNDRDGLLDADDGCPEDAEDLDGFSDADGCPDPDNDADGIADTADRCALEPEDADGFEDQDGCPDLDNDADGLADAKDACALEPEDPDAFQDLDGCPEPDNDGDGVLDATDKCPLQPEDKNGFQDDDGCPDDKNDRDHDGVLDKADGCPDAAEDRDGFEDENGCPELDNDGDGVPDAADLCPAFAEDLDQIADTDGCPEDDHDGDGIRDDLDKCPLEAEVINGVDDDDGCPDQGATLVALTATRIEIRETVQFRTGSDELDPVSFGLLNQIGAVLRNHQHVRTLEVAGHTDDTGELGTNQRLSEKRAQSVVGYLTRVGGVAPERLVAAGYGETRPVASNKTLKGREMNRRVEFLVRDTGTPPPAAAPVVPASQPAPTDAAAPPTLPPALTTPTDTVAVAPPAPPASSVVTPTAGPETKPPAAPEAASAPADPQLLAVTLAREQTLKELTTVVWGGTAALDAVLQANPGVADANTKLAVGTALRVPRTIPYTVVKGDSLGAIAKRFLGKDRYYRHIVAANTDVLPNPDAMEVGMHLRLPLVNPDSEKALAGR